MAAERPNAIGTSLMALLLKRPAEREARRVQERGIL
jgi:hypothetical protein